MERLERIRASSAFRLSSKGEEADSKPGQNDSETYDWFVNGKSAGRWTTARNLTYVSVYNSSHMVTRLETSRIGPFVD